jgi:crossover junction endodeoxyribonuclease RusA
MTLTLPWPSSVLLPNRKLHWAIKGRATSEARAEAWAVGLCERLKHVGTSPLFGIAGCTAHVTFHPPDRRRRDLDNLLRSIKPYFDGLTDAKVIIDDSCIKEISVRMAEPSKDSRVEIELTEVKG